MKRFYFLLLLTITINSYSQLRFEKGYIIDKNNITTECYIKNKEWKSPKKIEVKFNKTDSAKTITVDNLKEFCIYGYYKYINRTVQIDRSTSNKRLLTYDKNPHWQTEKLMLKVLVEGKTSLYYYEQGDLIRFFYSVSDTIKQLIYKKYLEEDYVINNVKIFSNNIFRRQIWMDLACSDIDENTVNKLSYSYDQLVKVFKDYNKCIGEQYYDYSYKEGTEYLNIKITPGINISNITINNKISNDKDFNVNNYTCFRFGVETELFLPFYNNKLSIIIEPTYNYFQKNKYFEIDSAYLKYNSIEFPVGLRYYFYPQNKTVLFIDGQYISNLSYIFNSHLHFNKPPTFTIKDGSSFSIGAGVCYKRFNAELRYYTNRKILADYYFWDAGYTRFSFIVGYKIFSGKTR